MAWKYPIYPVQDSHIIDTDQLNYNFLEVVSELSGELNEHNWKSNSWLDRNRLAKDAGLRLYDRMIVVNSVRPSTAAPSDWIKLTASDDWQVIPGDPAVAAGGNNHTFDLEITSTGATFWVVASLQMHYGIAAQEDTSLFPSVVGDIAPVDSGLGLLFAISINGNIIVESLLGSGDISGEKIELNPDGGIFFPIQTWAAPGIVMRDGAISIDAVVPLTAGKHKVEVRVLNYFAKSVGAYISNRELFVLEMIR